MGKNRESERKQSQTRAFVSRFESLALCPRLHRNEDFCTMVDPSKSLLYKFSLELLDPQDLLTWCLDTLQPRTRKIVEAATSRTRLQRKGDLLLDHQRWLTTNS